MTLDSAQRAAIFDKTCITVQKKYFDPKFNGKDWPSQARSVCFSRLEDEIGYLKATIFPGVLGIDVGRELDAAVASLKGCRRLIIDLRGHLGRGLGVLRLMSYLTPRRMPIGYTVTRRRAESGYQEEHLRRFGRIPSTKLAIPFVALQFAGRDESVAIFTEGLGPQKFHGRAVLLVNGHTYHCL